MDSADSGRREQASELLLRGRVQRNSDGSSSVYSSGRHSAYTSGAPLLPPLPERNESMLGEAQSAHSVEDVAGDGRPPYVTEASSDSLISKMSGRPHEYTTETSASERRPKTAVQRIGATASVTLIITLLINLAAVGFLLFLWKSNPGNHTWHVIMVRGWVTRAVSITSLVIRTATDFQAGIAVAVLASLLIEISFVAFKNAPVISVSRATQAAPSALILPIMSSWDTGTISVSLAFILLCATTYSLQLTSTVLLSDIRLGQLPTLASSNLTAIDFLYTYDPDYDNWYYPSESRGSTWQRPPPNFPAFAEYKEAIATPPGVDDTGTLLRAFLPFPDAQSRENIRNYTGKAVVLDSRVSCQPPKLDQLFIGGAGYALNEFPTALYFEGYFAPSRNVSRMWAPPLVNSTFSCPFFPINGVPFLCQPAGEGYSGFAASSSALGNSAGGLLSSFDNATNATALLDAEANAMNSGSLTASVVPYGAPFLLFNVTTSVEYYDRGQGWEIDTWHKYNLSQDASAKYSERGSWRTIHTHQPSNCQNKSADAAINCFPDSTADISVTLCYTSWDTARLDVGIYSDNARSEPIIGWTSENGTSTTPDLGAQMGLSGTDVHSRGTLTMSNTSWIPKSDPSGYPAIPPPLQTLASISTGQTDVAGSFQAGASGDTTLMLLSDGRNGAAEDALSTAQSFAIPITDSDRTLGTFFNQFLTRTNSPAQALSSMITILSSMAYYDQMPRYQYTTNSTQVYFAPVLFPHSHRGLLAVIIVLAAHTCLVFSMVVVFALRSRYSFVGNYWQAIAQLHSYQSEKVFANATLKTDKEVERQLKMAGVRDAKVGVGLDGDGQFERVGLVRKDR